MGTPKPWLQFDGRPLLEHLVERMRAAFPEVLVVTAPGTDVPPTSAPILYDEWPDAGPLAGLLTGLGKVQTPLALLASCDLPLLNPRVAVHLAELAAGAANGLPGAIQPDIVAPQWEGRLQPLHAVYRTGALPLFAEQFQAGCRRMMELLEGRDTLVVSQAQFQEWDPEGLSLFNINTPAQYELALRRWQQGRYEIGEK